MKKEKTSAPAKETAAETIDTTKSASIETPKKKKKKKGTKSAEKAEENLTEANVTKAAKDVESERSTKYIYAPGMTSRQKKDFRRKARATIEQFNKKIKKLTKSQDEADQKELKKVHKEYDAWKEQNLSPVSA